ncbi:hypothetical protein HUJ05_008835 [Dendroctonus ponderosae]|nr:hypothetical protein HUJ05_008835 [Dendroctonus ponderosae]
MFKFVVLLSAALAFAASASLRVNPDELHVIWDTIEKDIRVRQQEAELEIRNLLEPLRILVDDAREKLANDLQEANAVIQDEIRRIEQEPHANIEPFKQLRTVRFLFDSPDFVLDHSVGLLEVIRQLFPGIINQDAQRLQKSLRVNPDELDVIWDTIQQDIVVRQEAAQQEVRNVLEPLRTLVATANEKLTNDAEKHQAKVQEEIERIEQESHGSDIAGCVEEAKLELGRVDATLLIEHRLNISKIKRRAEVEIESAFKIISEITNEIDEFGTRIDSCSDVICASDLNVELVILYQRVVKDLNRAVDNANEATMIILGRELDESQLSKARYDAATSQLLEDLRACADERV